MRFACLFVVLGILGYVSPVHAYSPLIEIKPERRGDFPLVFEIRSERVERGEVKFTIKVADGTLKLREDYRTALSAVHVTESSSSAGPTHPIPAVREGKWIVCVFTVTEKELEDPDLAFSFSMPEPNYPAVDYFYARLKNFVKP